MKLSSRISTETTSRKIKAMIRIIGDVHAKFDEYFDIAKGVERSVQVGDFGVGFFKDEDYARHNLSVLGQDHRFIRGNHDDPQKCKTFSNYIVDGFVHEDIMFVGGAKSVDAINRVEGTSWWKDEELDYAQW